MGNEPTTSRHVARFTVRFCASAPRLRLAYDWPQLSTVGKSLFQRAYYFCDTEHTRCHSSPPALSEDQQATHSRETASISTTCEGSTRIGKILRRASMKTINIQVTFYSTSIMDMYRSQLCVSIRWINLAITSGLINGFDTVISFCKNSG